MDLILGDATPMIHQAEDVERLSRHARINIWNGLGTGKTCTVAWWLQRQWLAGAIDEVVAVLPSMCAKDWEDTLCGLAWPEGLVEFLDCRPPDQGWVREVLTSGLRSPPGRLRVMCTTYGGVRSLIFAGDKSKRKVARLDHPVLVGARGRRIALICDESQMAALGTSAQGTACRAVADSCRAVGSVTATPIGNPLQMRLWGMTRLVRPDLLMRHDPDTIRGRPVGKRGSFSAFRMRYAHLRDPQEGRIGRGGRPMPFIIGRAYPVDIHTELMQREILGPMAPFTTRRKKDDCLDLPEKVYLTRYYDLPPAALRAMEGLLEDDRAVLESGRVVVPRNVLEERLRTLELTGGWIEGEPVHFGKLSLLRDVLAEIRDALGDGAPACVWASRSREIVACALVAAGASPEHAQQAASAAYPPGEAQAVTSEYRSIIERCSRERVGILHGPTPDRDRDAIQEKWKSGSYHTVVAHPGVAGAGLNWQHVKATVYYSPPLGTIARQQSEDRVHRHRLKHTALYYDCMLAGGPDEAVVMAHRQQRDAAQAILDWMSEFMRG